MQRVHGHAKRGCGVVLGLVGLFGGGCPEPARVPADGSGSETSSTTAEPSTTTAVSGLDTTAGTSDATSSSSTGDGTTAFGTSSSGSSTDGSSSGTGSTSSGGESSSGGTSSGGDVFMCPPGGGTACADPSDCVSNACYVAGPLGGVCSECDEDADCAMGCSAGNPLLGACAFCCDGSLGCGCETDVACQPGLSCELLFDVPGILSVRGCSDCASDADCAGGQLCSPTTDLNQVDGYYTCVAPGSKAIDEPCSEAGSGDAQCASGQCAIAALMGIPILTVCSVCNEDADCAGGTCVLPEIVINGDLLEVTSGQCV